MLPLITLFFFGARQEMYKAMDCGVRNQFHSSGLEQFTARFS